MRKIIFAVLLFLLFNLTNAQDLSNIQSQPSSSDMQALNLINVTVGGAFVINGTFPALRTERVDQFVTRVFSKYESQVVSGTKDKELLDVLKAQLNSYAKRDITLKRFDGTELKVDLEKFRLTGDFSYNPYLKNNDVLIFPVLDLERNYIDISGAVNLPVKFQFVEGDKLSDAILFANGLNPAYKNITTAEISRLSYNGEKQVVKKINISDNPYLQRGDRIKIIAENNQKVNYKVLVLGEVQQPGYVYITKNNTTLKNVIKNSGGFTKYASLERSTILRGTNEDNILRIKALEYLFSKDKNVNVNEFTKKFDFSKLENLSMLRMSDAQTEDTIYYSIDMKLRQFENNGLVDFTKIFSDDSTKNKFIVKDGDVILVPEKSNTVYVFGQVNSPGYVPFDTGKDFNYYIKKAGGFGEDYKDDIKIIKGKTKSWLSADESTEINPGDFVYVPKSPPRNLFYYLRTASFITSIASALATVAILILNLKK